MGRDPDPQATETYGHQGPNVDSAADHDAPEQRPERSPTRLLSLKNSFDRGESLGRYLVLDRLGSGGMGVVYTAYDPQLDRKVALKLLKIKVLGRSRRQEAHQRLVREAQALARLNHPNVVAVHDIGEVGDRIFLAMEYIDGQDLKHWLLHEERPWQEIVDVFVQAGRGLSAAHRAGLLHRDFKPANVILGSDGRARVLDFGLARPVEPGDGPEVDVGDPHGRHRIVDALPASERRPNQDESSAPTEGMPAPAGPPKAVGSSTNISIGALNAHLTRTGSFLGTLAYMSPEQIDGKVDPRSDQFSFCVALYEALWGHSPFIDRTGMLKRAMQSNIQAPPRTGEVPLWLERVVMRGLRVDPEQRYGSMDALLDELQRRPTQRAWWLAAVLVALMLTGALIWGPSRTPCTDLDGPIRAVWNEPKRREMAAVFDSSSLPFAPSLWNRAQTLLDHYVDDWSAMRRETCEATRIHGTQSEALLDLRMTCLGQRARELDSLLSLFRVGGDEIVRESIRALARLPSIEQCADSKSLLTVVAPINVEEQARTDAVLAELAQISAMLSLRQKDQADERLRNLQSTLGDFSHASTLAQVHRNLGWAAAMNDRREEAKAEYLTAVALADKGRDDSTRVNALQNLILELENEPEQAQPWLRAAQGAVQRLGSKKHEAKWHQAQARILYRAGDSQAALAAAETAAALAREHFGPDNVNMARILIDLGNVQFRLEMNEQAFASYSEVGRIQTLNLGPLHPDTAISNYLQARTLARLKRFAEARPLLEEGLRTMESTYGPEHSRVAEYLIGTGVVYWRLGDKQAALQAYGRAISIRESVAGHSAGTTAPLLNNVALIHWESGELDAAEHHLRRALELYRLTYGEDHPQVLISKTNLARVMLHQNRANESLALLRPTWEHARSSFGDQHTTSMNSGLALGEALLALGRSDSARRQIETMATLITTKEPAVEDWLLGALCFAQARLYAASGDRNRATRYSRQAGAVFLRMGESGAFSLQRWKAWAKAEGL